MPGRERGGLDVSEAGGREEENVFAFLLVLRSRLVCVKDTETKEKRKALFSTCDKGKERSQTT